ncbi:MAG: hypothetical protein PVJ07_09470 [Anaerolineales bacterium]|jgi:hypothetical protein
MTEEVQQKPKANPTLKALKIMAALVLGFLFLWYGCGLQGEFFPRIGISVTNSMRQSGTEVCYVTATLLDGEGDADEVYMDVVAPIRPGGVTSIGSLKPGRYLLKAYDCVRSILVETTMTLEKGDPPILWDISELGW